MKLIMLDVDAVVADLHAEWLRLYNHDYNDQLMVEEITDWDMTKFVKPECGKSIYKYLEFPDLYNQIQPIDGALSGVKHLRSLGHRVVFATSGTYSHPKYHWLVRNDFDPGEWGRDYMVVHDKGLLKGDLLIDDRPKNIEDFGSPKSIIFSQPWNKTFFWNYRAESWHDVTRIIYDFDRL